MVGLFIGLARLSSTRMPVLRRLVGPRDHGAMTRFARIARWGIVALLTTLFVFHSFVGHAAHGDVGKAPAHIHLAADENSGATEDSVPAERHHHLAQEDHSHSFSLAAQLFTTAPAVGRDSRWPLRHDSLLAALRYGLERPPRPHAQG